MPRVLKTVCEWLLYCVLALVVGILLYVWMGKFPAQNSSDMAAWVQAIGSIVTVLAAFLVVNHQIRLEGYRQTKAKCDEDKRLLSIVCSLVAQASVEAEGLFMRRTEPGRLEFLEDRTWMKFRFQDIQHAISSIPVHLLPNANSARYVLTAIRIVRACEEVAANALAGDAEIVGNAEYGLPWFGFKNELTELVSALELESKMLGG